MLLASSAFAQKPDPEGEAVKGMIFGMMGQLMQNAQREMMLEELKRRGQSGNVQSPNFNNRPPPPELPPLPSDGRRNEWRR
jgi:hypothetical protein